MSPAEALRFAQSVLVGAKLPEAKEGPSPANFHRYAQLVTYVIRDIWTSGQRQSHPELRQFAQVWRRMYDEFDEMVKRDPMIRYTPKHSVAAAFHKSLAARRYFRAGNRSSKTQSAIAEHYWVATGTHPWRRFPTGATTTVLLSGLPFTVYAPKVFEKKFLYGEDFNELSPVFPEGGKWFYHYDSRQRIITLGCEACASEGKAASCPGHHPKSTVSLLSVENGVGVLEAFAATLGHIDEHVPEEFYHALKQRLASVPGSSLIVTGTPLHGLGSWETMLLANTAEGPSVDNLSDPDDPNSPPLVELFEIDQFSAGIVPHAKIRESMADMDEAEIQARVYGKPTPLADRPVFNRTQLTNMAKDAKEPQYGQVVPGEKDTYRFEPEILQRKAINFTGVRLWELPQPGKEYIAAIDSAAGLAPGTKSVIPDASCCSILKVTLTGMNPGLELVAQYWGWINPLDYAAECFKLASFYNDAMAVIELTGGLGRAVMLRLRELGYWHIFRDSSKPEVAEFGQDPRLGVETNASTKPAMVSMLQQFLKDGRLAIRDIETIKELQYFEQIAEGSGGAMLQIPKYKGAGNSKDDRVMSLAIGVSVFLTHPHLFDFAAASAKIEAQSNAATSTDEVAHWNALREDLAASASIDDPLFM